MLKSFAFTSSASVNERATVSTPGQLLQLASGCFENYQQLVRYAIGMLKDREADLDELTEQLRPGIEALQRGEPGVELDFDQIKKDGRRRLNAPSSRS